VRTRDRLPIVIKALCARSPAPRDIERLRREYEIGRRLDSPYVIEPYDLEMDEGRLMLIAKDFGGEPLSRFLGAPLDVGWFLDIAIQLAAALAYIHRQGIVHRDIKPANILIYTRTGEVKLTNFGIAAPLAHISISTPSSSLIEGSLAYMSPEQTGRMNRGIDYRSDLYSIGVTFYEMLTGALPF
jgi:serine/threonine protein kinase